MNDSHSLDEEKITIGKEEKDVNEDNDIIILLPRNETDESKGISIKRKYTLISKLIKTSMEKDHNVPSIPLNITSQSLQYIGTWMNQKKGVVGKKIARPLKKTIRESCNDKWDAEFIESVDQKNLNNLFEAADYLEIEDLFILCGVQVAFLIRGKSIDEVKKVLSVEC